MPKLTSKKYNFYFQDKVEELLIDKKLTRKEAGKILGCSDKMITATFNEICKHKPDLRNVAREIEREHRRSILQARNLKNEPSKSALVKNAIAIGKELVNGDYAYMAWR